MPKRVKYTGGFADGIRVFVPDGPAQGVVVLPGHQLEASTDANVPAALRDELAERPDWELVDYTAPSAKAEAPKSDSKEA